MMLFIRGAPSFSCYWEDQLAEFGKDHFAVAAPDAAGISPLVETQRRSEQ